MDDVKDEFLNQVADFVMDAINQRLKNGDISLPPRERKATKVFQTKAYTDGTTRKSARGIPTASALRRFKNSEGMKALAEFIQADMKQTNRTPAEIIDRMISNPTPEVNIMNFLSATGFYSQAAIDQIRGYEDVMVVSKPRPEAKEREEKIPEREAKEREEKIPERIQIQPGTRREILQELNSLGLRGFPTRLGIIPWDTFKSIPLVSMLSLIKGAGAIPPLKKAAEMLDRYIGREVKGAAERKFQEELKTVIQDTERAFVESMVYTNPDAAQRLARETMDLKDVQDIQEGRRLTDQQARRIINNIMNLEESKRNTMIRQYAGLPETKQQGDIGLGDLGENNERALVLLDGSDEKVSPETIRMGQEAVRRTGRYFENLLLPSALTSIAAGIGAGIASGNPLEGLGAAALSAAGSAATIGSGIVEKVSEKLGVSDDTKEKAKRVVPALVGGLLAGSNVGDRIEQVVETVSGIKREKAALPTQVVKQQKSNVKRQWRPKMIAPSSQILEPTKKEAVMNEMLFTAFDYVPEGSEGGNGNADSNVLMGQQEIESELRFLGWRKQILERELMFRKQRGAKPRPPPLMQFDNMDPSQYETNVYDPEQPLGYNSPYKFFTDVDGLNVDIKRSELYGVVP
jgi:hypothetical protein